MVGEGALDGATQLSFRFHRPVHVPRLARLRRLSRCAFIPCWRFHHIHWRRRALDYHRGTIATAFRTTSTATNIATTIASSSTALDATLIASINTA